MSKTTNREEEAIRLCILHLDTIEADKRYSVVGNPMRGKCYLASIALLQFLGGKGNGYSLFKGMDDEGITHYWVASELSAILDPTASQYIDFKKQPPYENGRKVGYRGNLKRHRPLLDKMNQSRKLTD